MKISGVGVSELSSEAHLEVSASTKVVSFVCAWLAAAGVRREMVSTLLMDGWLRRVVRMWLPFLGRRRRVVVSCVYSEFCMCRV